MKPKPPKYKIVTNANNKKKFSLSENTKGKKDGVWVDVDNEIVRNSKHFEIDIGVT